jgi:hypothetical protein
MSAAGVSPPPPRLPGAAPIVWGAWAGLLLLALVYVARFGSRLPFYDDWSLVPVLTGARPLTPACLWEPFNEHRLPLPRLALYALGWLSGLDFRAGLVLNVLLLGGLAFALLRTAGRVRGSLHFADAFLPLLVLGLAQWESFLIEFALNLVGSTVVAGAFLILLTGSGSRPSARRAAGMAGCVVLLPLFGASGLALVPALVPWLAFVGVGHCRAADVRSRRLGLLVLGLVAAALLLCGLYLVGLPHPGPGPRPVRPAAVLARGLQVLSMLLGKPGLSFAPWQAGVVPAALLAAAGGWLVAWRRHPAERVVLLGFLAFLLGMLCLVGAVAWGRAEVVSRYATLLVPLGCCLYFLAGRYGGTSAGPAAQMALCLLTAVVFLPNLRAALDRGSYRHLRVRGFEADVAAHVPPAVLAELGAGRVIAPEARDELALYLGMLRDARAGAFARLPADPPLRVTALPADAAALHDLLWAGDTARPVGADPTLEFALPRPAFVYAVRLHYAYTNPLGSPDVFAFSWRRGGHGPRVLLLPGERTVTVRVNDRIDRFRMVPAIKMFALRLTAVELLEPGEPAAAVLSAGGAGG